MVNGFSIIGEMKNSSVQKTIHIRTTVMRELKIIQNLEVVSGKHIINYKYERKYSGKYLCGRTKKKIEIFIRIFDKSI